MTAAPTTIDAFLRRPTREEWVAVLQDGWTGPDGSSCSLDNIEGVRIGITSPDWLHVDLAANRHDWYYELGRRFRLGSEYRKAADLAHLRMLKAQTDAVLIGWNAWKARRRAEIRYGMLRLLGWRSWRKR